MCVIECIYSYTVYMWFCTLNLKQRAVWSSWNPLISRPSIIYNIFPLINLSNYVLHWFKKMLTIIKGGTMSAFKPKQRARSTFSSAASAILGGIPMQTILSALAICLSSSSMWRSVQSRPCCMTTYETLICSLTKNACQGLNHLLGSGREKSPTEKWGEWVWYGK